MPYTQTDLAYIAGILDADGFIGLVRGSRRKNGRYYYQPKIRVGQEEMNAIELCEKTFGGCISEIKPTLKVFRHRNRIDWQLTGGPLVKKALELLLPYLRIKYPQAVNTLTYIELRLKVPYSKLGKKEDGLYEWHKFFVHGGKIPNAI